MRRAAVVIVSSVVLLAASGCGGVGGAGGRDGGDVIVTRVVDGDTVLLRVGETEETARLLGIDTPESVKPNSPIECFGPEASANLKALLPTGSRVRLERDVEPRDRYGRLLVHIYRRPDDRHVNLAQLEMGFAEPLTIAPNRAHAGELSAAAQRARAAGRGMWSACPAGARGPP